ncbi:MAG: LPXTG cell wall anchor domain-containing protein [Limosilactobacillus sp.]|uniref:LPXTG cell wall anchor domain-containing protein n=1 Tax=Limosilactobacillus sp. TaxID=2773925 RepID=UPI0026F563E4|nr:LPXTG cell wall anchor domain-containing protein [Limosilactobacillus sp.]
MKKQPTYRLRKLTIGVCSVALMAIFVTQAHANTVYADTETATSQVDPAEENVAEEATVTENNAAQKVLINGTGTEDTSWNGTVTGTNIIGGTPRVNITAGGTNTIDHISMNTPAGTLGKYYAENNLSDVLVDSMQGKVVGTTDPSKYDSQIGGGNILNAGNVANISNAGLNYDDAAKASTKVYLTAADAKVDVQNMAVGDFAIIPVIVEVMPYEAYNGGKPTFYADAEPNAFYSYRLIYKMADDQFAMAFDDTQNVDGTYPTYTADTIENTYWLNANGKVAYKGVVSRSGQNPIAVYGNYSDRRSAGTAIRSSNNIVTSYTANELLTKPAIFAYFMATPVDDKSALTIKSADLTASTDDTVDSLIKDNVTSAKDVDDNDATYVPVDQYNNLTEKDRAGKYTISVTNSDGDAYDFSGKLPAGTYTVSYILPRYTSENPISAYNFTEVVKATLTVKEVEPKRVDVQIVDGDDNNAILETLPTFGKPGEEVDVPSYSGMLYGYEQKGYKIKSDGTNNGKITIPEDDNPILIVLEHDTAEVLPGQPLPDNAQFERGDFDRTVKTQIIELKDDGTKLDYGERAVWFGRTVTYDKVTGKMVSATDWKNVIHLELNDEGILSEMEIKKDGMTTYIDGVETNILPAKIVNHETPDDTVIVQFKKVETPVEPTEPTEPVTPTDPTEPVTPTEPTEPVAPTDPTEPVTPTEPTEPVTPTDPTTPVEPVTPVAPTEPTTPAKPEEETAKNDVDVANADKTVGGDVDATVVQTTTVQADTKPAPTATDTKKTLPQTGNESSWALIATGALGVLIALLGLKKRDD